MKDEGVMAKKVIDLTTDGHTDGRTDGHTDGRTVRQTDRVSYRSASHLKIEKRALYVTRCNQT